MNHNSPSGKTLRLLRLRNPALGVQFKELTVAAADQGTPCMQAPDLWWSDERDEQLLAIEGCQACPIKNMCLQWSVDAFEREGVWGGMNSADRRKLMDMKEREARNERRRNLNLRRAQEAFDAETARLEAEAVVSGSAAAIREQVRRRREANG